MNTEQWRPVAIDPFYEVSDFGRVRSVDRVTRSGPPGGYMSRDGKDIVPWAVPRTGYLQVQLSRRKRESVHRLVAAAFCDGYAAGKVVNHINGDRTDNRACNLEWVTHSENMQHAYRVLGATPSCKGRFSADHPTSKPVIATCLLTGRQAHYGSASEAKRTTGLSGSYIAACCKGRRASYGGFTWQYAAPVPAQDMAA